MNSFNNTQAQTTFANLQELLTKMGADSSSTAGATVNPTPDPSAVSAVPDSGTAPQAPAADAATATSPVDATQAGDTAAGTDSINNMMGSLTPDIARNIMASLKSIIDGNKEKANGLIQDMIIPALFQYIDQTLQSPDYVNMILQQAMANPDFMGALAQQVSSQIQANMFNAMNPAQGQAPMGAAPQQPAAQGAPAPAPQQAPAPVPQDAAPQGAPASTDDTTKSSAIANMFADIGLSA